MFKPSRSTHAADYQSNFSHQFTRTGEVAQSYQCRQIGGTDGQTDHEQMDGPACSWIHFISPQTVLV